ncbi:DUF4214 domain-containing protein [Sphingomonas crocodyli]|uniref:DUF4214 domain-containing protein n=1 Tax=Sphingomonas crocodyli TaxID=1979270 RepID=A0A437MBC0_9SPHN|nr:DUF4214 domain-containing protein [Sphingomonas crocodyli]RVT94949.1 DUF4214 domain-containing protein [Sphingomonas crocodyli]
MDLFDTSHRNPYLRANSMEELCSFADVNFVRCAFITVLGRQPDPTGEAFYAAKLRRGATKLSVLLALRRSAEGRSHDPGIAGFDKALRRHHHANRRFVGWIVRLFTGEPGNTLAERQFRMLENSIGYERELAAERFAVMHDYLFALDRRIARIQRQSSGQGASLRSLGQAEYAADDEWEAALNRALN